MRITAVDVYSENADENFEPIRFSLEPSDPRAQYQVRTILGIDAEEIIQKFNAINLNGNATFDFSLKPRDIVMRVVLNPRTILGETFSSLRDHLYRQISANALGGIRLVFMSGATSVAAISGYISKFEVAHFERLPEIQVTVHCIDPMLRAVVPTEYGPDPDEEKLVAINAETIFQIPDTVSTAPHGMAIVVKFTGTSATFTIQDDDSDPTWSFQVDPDGSFIADDILAISSEFTNKYVLFTRGVDTAGMANVVVPGSIWPLIFPHPTKNLFHIPERANLDIISLTYYPAFWGV